MLWGAILSLLYFPYVVYLCLADLSPLEMYQRLESKWGGKTIYGFLLGFFSPYSGSISPQIISFTPHHCQIRIKDTWSLLNVYHSIHALAIGNLGELAIGLMMFEHLQRKSETSGNNYRGIITQIHCEYYKKARGSITATCRISDIKEQQVSSQIVNLEGETVAKITCHWDIKSQ